MKRTALASQVALIVMLSLLPLSLAVELVPWPDNDRVPLTPPPGERFTTLLWGRDSRLETAQQTAIKSEAELQQIWSQVDSRGVAPPSLDFDQDMVILIAAGRQPGVNYIFVTGIDRLPDRWVVHYTQMTTPPFCRMRTAPGRPFHLARTTRTNLHLEFQRHKQNMRCLRPIPRPLPRPPRPIRPPPPVPQPDPQPIR